jgi:hypothetical protein
MSNRTRHNKLKHVFSVASVGLFSLLLLGVVAVIIGLITSYFYIPIRLYLIGHTGEATVVSCETITSAGQHGSQTTYEVRLEEFEGVEFPVGDWGKCDLQAGDTVALLYSDKLQSGVVLPGGRSLFHVIYNYGNSLVGCLLVVVVLLGLGVGGVIRIVFFVHVLLRLVRLQWRRLKLRRGSMPVRAARISEFALDLAFIVTSICFLAVLFFGITKGVLYVEGTPAPVVGLAVFCSVAVFFSPLLERVVWWVLRWRNRNPVMTIIRNIVAVCALMFGSWKAIRFIAEEDLQSYDGLLDLAKAMFNALIS